jgi:nucleoside-diphosphate-sugar epimerase
MKICITGGAGFIGSNIYKDLITKGHSVRVIDNLSTGKLDNLPQGATVIVKDIIRITEKDLKDIDIVFHCAALARVQISIKQPLYYNETNVNGTLKVLEAARQAGVKKVIYSASSSVYGDSEEFPTKECCPANPISPYALQKYIGELYCKQYSLLYNLETICLRYFNVYGEGMSIDDSYTTVIGIFKHLKDSEKPLTITNDGCQRRDFTYVKDVVNANILAMESNKQFKGQSINIGSGSNYSVNEIAETFGGPVEFVGNVVEPKVTLADNSLAKSQLGWETTKDVIEWIKENK